MTTLPTTFLGKTISLGTSTFGEIVTPYYVAASNSNDAFNIALASDISNSSMAVKFHMDYTKVLERATKAQIDTLANSINTVGADSNVRNTVLSVDAALNETMNTVISKLQLIEHFCLLVNQNVTIQGENGSVLPTRGVGSFPWAVASYTKAEPKLLYNLSTLSRDMPNQSGRLLSTNSLPTFTTVPDVFSTDGSGAGPGSFVSFDFANAPIVFDNSFGEFPQSWNFSQTYTWGTQQLPTRFAPNYSFLPFEANRPGFSDLAFDAGKNALYFKQTNATIPGTGFAPNDPFDVIKVMMYAIQEFRQTNPHFGPDSFTITIYNVVGITQTTSYSVVKPTAFSLSGSDTYGLATVQVTRAPLLINYGHTTNVSTQPYPTDIVIPDELDGRNPNARCAFKINYDYVQILSNSGVGQWENNDATDYNAYEPNNTFNWSINYNDQVSAQLSQKPQFLVNENNVLSILKSQYYQSSGPDGDGIGTLSDRVVIYNITQIINSVPDIANVQLLFTSGSKSIRLGFYSYPNAPETFVGRWTDQYYAYNVIVLTGPTDLKDAFTFLGNSPFTLKVEIATF